MKCNAEYQFKQIFDGFVTAFYYFRDGNGVSFKFEQRNASLILLIISKLNDFTPNEAIYAVINSWVVRKVETNSRSP